MLLLLLPCLFMARLCLQYDVGRWHVLIQQVESQQLLAAAAAAAHPPLSTSCHMEKVGKDGRLGGLQAGHTGQSSKQKQGSSWCEGFAALQGATQGTQGTAAGQKSAAVCVRASERCSYTSDARHSQWRVGRPASRAHRAQQQADTGQQLALGFAESTCN
jgi:hypothetical protein